MLLRKRRPSRHDSGGFDTINREDGSWGVRSVVFPVLLVYYCTTTAGILLVGIEVTVATDGSGGAASVTGTVSS